MSRPAVAWILLFLAAACPRVAADESLDVLAGEAGELLHARLIAEVSQQAEARREAVRRALESREAFDARRDMLAAAYREMLGAFPAKTPLNPRVVGTIRGEAYRIERVVYESRPGHHVTANLYVPTTGTGPFPGVLVPCGHSANGKANAAYQSVCILLAKNGIVALIYDPIGQGERHQLKAATRHGTTEHTLVGIGALLVGRTTASYRVWDGIRSMDYLAGRPEVDATRLGCTGNSGGGTMTTWLMAIDERIRVAAPSCFITTAERVFSTIGPQDCEQHFPRQGPLGVEHVDFITMRAPKPTLILAAEQDFFDFGGTQETHREAKEIYRFLGYPDQVDLFSYNDKHGFSRPRREAAVGWMLRWLAEHDVTVVESEASLQEDPALQVTISGQVVDDYPDETTVTDFTLAEARRLEPQRRRFAEANDQDQVAARIRELLGLARPVGKVETQSQGQVTREGYTIEKLILSSADDIPIPALVVSSGESPRPQAATILVTGSGKQQAAAPGGLAEHLARAGRLVVCLDVCGMGETADQGSEAKYHNSEFRSAMLAMHVGRPLLGRRVAHVLAAVAWLQARDDVDAQAIELVGVGRGGPIVLHAGVLEPAIAKVRESESIESWIDDVILRPLAPELIGQAVPGVLAWYDLPDLRARLGSRHTMLEPDERGGE